VVVLSANGELGLLGDWMGILDEMTFLIHPLIAGAIGPDARDKLFLLPRKGTMRTKICGRKDVDERMWRKICGQKSVNQDEYN